jgi:hypothetical protein
MDSDQGNWDDYNQRLLYLLGVAVCRRVAPLLPDPSCRRVLEVAESFAEGKATLDDLAEAHEAIDTGPSSHLPAATEAAADALFWLSPDDYKVIRVLWYVGDAIGYSRATAAGVLPVGATRGEREAIWKHPTFLAGRDAELRAVCDLIREVIGNPFRPSPSLADQVLRWNSGTVRRLAQGVYDEPRMPEGTLDNARLAVLADALEEAGCTDLDLLGHLRGSGGHVRGCWALDVVLGKGVTT